MQPGRLYQLAPLALTHAAAAAHAQWGVSYSVDSMRPVVPAPPAPPSPYTPTDSQSIALPAHRGTQQGREACTLIAAHAGLMSWKLAGTCTSELAVQAANTCTATQAHQQTGRAVRVWACVEGRQRQWGTEKLKTTSSQGLPSRQTLKALKNTPSMGNHMPLPARRCLTTAPRRCCPSRAAGRPASCAPPEPPARGCPSAAAPLQEPAVGGAGAWWDSWVGGRQMFLRHDSKEGLQGFPRVDAAVHAIPQQQQQQQQQGCLSSSSRSA